MISFGERLSGVFERHGQLCVGIDPHEHLLKEWDLPNSAAGVREFGLRVVEAARGRVGILKPQVAFYERFGAAGFAGLEEIIGEARSSGLLVIADAKRGDIGSTSLAYGQAWLSAGAPLEADALTATAYTGVGALDSVFDVARHNGKGVFVLAATSNDEAFPLQSAHADAHGEFLASTVAARVAAEIARGNTVSGATALGLVLGATQDLTRFGIDVNSAELAGTPVLAPGFGSQGAEFHSVHEVFGSLAPSTIVSVSRSVLEAGMRDLSEAISYSTNALKQAMA